MSANSSIGRDFDLAEASKDSELGENAWGIHAGRADGARRAGCAYCREPFKHWEKVVHWGGLQAVPTSMLMAGWTANLVDVYFHGECAVRFADHLFNDALQTEAGSEYAGDLSFEDRWAASGRTGRDGRRKRSDSRPIRRLGTDYPTPQFLRDYEKRAAKKRSAS